MNIFTFDKFIPKLRRRTIGIRSRVEKESSLFRFQLVVRESGNLDDRVAHAVDPRRHHLFDVQQRTQLLVEWVEGNANSARISTSYHQY